MRVLCCCCNRDGGELWAAKVVQAKEAQRVCRCRRVGVMESERGSRSGDKGVGVVVTCAFRLSKIFSIQSVDSST